MYIYLIWQQQYTGYDTYDFCVVCADSEEEAKSITPDGNSFGGKYMQAWADSIEYVECKKIGIADLETKKGVICASFNAG